MREQRRVFVKHRPSDARVYRPDLTKDGEQEAHSMHLALLKINRWGLYEAYKMLKYKQAWFDIVENKNKAPVADDELVNRDKDESDKENEDDDDSVEDKKSEKNESGKEDDDEKSDDDKESDDEESEPEESEEESEDEESEDESEDDDDDDDDKKEETEKESEDSENDEDRPKTSGSDGAGPSDKKK